MINFSQIADQMGLPYAIFSAFYYPLFFILLLTGGIAFLLLKRWGKVLAQLALTIDILVRAYGTITALPIILKIAEIKKTSPIHGLKFGFAILLIDFLIF